MGYLIAYIGVLVVFGAADACWLGIMGPLVYRPALGEIGAKLARGACDCVLLELSDRVVMFAVTPGLRAGLASSAFFPGILFGALAYGTYDLTNYATLRHWTLQITILDILYGALLSGIAAVASYALVRVTLGSSSLP